MDPYWMYKAGKDGEVMSKLFDTKKLPKGWQDSPKAAKAEKSKPVAIKSPEINDDNSTGVNQQLSIAGGDTGSESDANRGNELGRAGSIEQDALSLAE